jgi:hypothetical protein
MPITSTVGGSSPSPIGIRPVSSWTPPAPIAAAESDVKVKRTSTETESATPAIPGIPAHVKTPSKGTGIIIVSHPGTVPPTRAINQGWSVDITAHVSWIIPHIHHLGCRFIYIDILDIVVRIVGRQGVDLIRYVVAHLPGAAGTIGDVPHSFITAVILALDLED